MSSYEGVARVRGWRLGQGVGLNTLTASIGTASMVFTALGVDPNAVPVARYGLSLVSGKPMPYTSPWYDLDAIVVHQGTMDIFDGYFIRSLKWKWLFGDTDNTERIRGFATISSNRIDLAVLNIRLEVRGDSLYSQDELLPDTYRTSLIYVRAPQAGASAREGQ